MFYMLKFFADMSEEREIYELRDHRTVQLPVHSYEAHRGRGTAIVIENGGQEVRAGWAGDRDPSLAFRSVLAKTRRARPRSLSFLQMCAWTRPFVMATPQVRHD